MNTSNTQSTATSDTALAGTMAELPDATPQLGSLNPAPAEPGSTAGPGPAATPDSSCEDDLNRQLINRICVRALACGLVADGFSWAFGFGLNLAVYCGMIVISAASVLHLRYGAVPRASKHMLQLAFVFATLLCVRESMELTLLNFVACASSIVFALVFAAPPPFISLLRARIGDLLAGITRTALETTYAIVPVTMVIASSSRAPARAAVASVVRVVTLSAVVAITFASLLAAGDPVFRNATQWLTNWNAGTIVQHMGVIAIFAWPVLGVMWSNASLRRARTPYKFTDFVPWSLRTVDVVSALIALNLVFSTFVALQARALFGGQQYVLATTGLSLAEYARGGFFTLIATSGLVLSALLAFNVLLPGEGLSQSRMIRRLSGVLLLLDGVVLTSAAARMTIYMNVFGASLERVYAMAIIGWLAVVMLWFAVTVLRGRPAHFAFGALVVGWSTLLMLNVASPDVLIARNHLARAARGELHDADYLARQLSADVVPLLVSAAQTQIATQSPQRVCSCAELCAKIPVIRARWRVPVGSGSVGSWSYGRWRARRALALLSANSATAEGTTFVCGDASLGR